MPVEEIPPHVNGANKGVVGLLGYLRYNVTKDGPNQSGRQSRLKYIYEVELITGSNSDNASYIAEFGEPESDKRYYKIRRFLESHIEMSWYAPAGVHELVVEALESQQFSSLETRVLPPVMARKLTWFRSVSFDTQEATHPVATQLVHIYLCFSKVSNVPTPNILLSNQSRGFLPSVGTVQYCYATTLRLAIDDITLPHID